MAIDLYLMEASSPCRAVLMTAKQLGIDLNKKVLNLMKQEHLTPEFLKINPQHCIPTIDDNGFRLWESRAILTYLANKYAPNNELYPKDPKQRAVVDRFLYFDIGTLYKTVADFAYGPLFRGEEKSEEKEKALKNSLTLLDGFLEKTPYVAGKHLTLADLSILSNVTFLEILDFDISEFPHLQSWVSKLKNQLPYYKEINDAPLQQFKAYIESQKKK